jgi:hypothetical protein
MLDDFTLRFSALLDGLAILRMRQMHQPSRKRLIDLAMVTARAELGGDPAVPSADPAVPSADPAVVSVDPAAPPADPADPAVVPAD